MTVVERVPWPPSTGDLLVISGYNPGAGWTRIAGSQTYWRIYTNTETTSTTQRSEIYRGWSRPSDEGTTYLP